MSEYVNVNEMKWNTIFISLVLMTTGSLWTIDGGSLNPNKIIPRDPFYTEAAYCNLDVVLNTPQDNDVFYTSQIDINYTLIGNPTYCWYKIDNNLWNNIPCNGSIKRTMPEGEQTLTLYVEQGGCSAMDAATYTVIDFKASLVGDFDLFLFLPLLAVLLIILEDDASQRESRTQENA
jgi:hypothetical protein